MNYIAVIILILAAFLWLQYRRRTTRFGAPFVATDPYFVERVMDLAALRKGEIFYDLGSGDGRLVIAASLRGADAYGVEIDPLRYWYSKAWIKLLRLPRATIVRRNFFEVDLSRADVVCLFLLQETNEKLEQKLAKELKPGTRVISIAFNFPHWKPAKVDPVETAYGPIYLYIR